MMMAMQGDELQALRKAAGLTGAALAEAIGMSRKSIVEMEAGRAPIERRTELAALYLTDHYSVEPTKDGRYMVVRRTVREMNNLRAMASFHGNTTLQGVFRRRDHAYRWAAALRSSSRPLPTRQVRRDRAAAIASADAGQ